MARKKREGRDIPHKVETDRILSDPDDVRDDPDRHSFQDYLDAAAFQEWDLTSHID